MEIERKFLITKLPADLASYPCCKIEQAYLCTEPVIRIRRRDDNYILTCKGKGFLAREEYEMPLPKDSYEHLLKKADGNIIKKTRYFIPYENGLTIELDHFASPMTDLYLAEVEFSSEEEANAFVPPVWFSEDVTYDERYHNSYMSTHSF